MSSSDPLENLVRTVISSWIIYLTQGERQEYTPPAATWRLLAKCHQRRNMAEYEGLVDVEVRLLDGLIAATHEVLEAARRLPLPE